ncbi:hypothetical protein GCM10009760_63610 [Kitasatospora kazusensis]|uniref:Uncharacterized protein n=1 Tax=Kitasatospora kazusensis TaxID=407974 RepID=A0ABN1ZME6_9ACTN
MALMALAGWLVWRAGLYPGNWRYSLGIKYQENRRDLRAAREKLRQLEQSVGQEQDGARSAVAAAVSSHRLRVRQAELRLARLQDPGHGALRTELAGTLRLYDHVLEVTAEGRITAHPLTKVLIRDEYSPSAGHIYLTLPNGFRQLLTFSLKETPEAEVRAFVVDIHNAFAADKAAKAERKVLIPQARAQLKAAIADTSGQERARQRLGEVRARLKGDTRIPQARRELDAARDRWQQLTGHRPQ